MPGANSAQKSTTASMFVRTMSSSRSRSALTNGPEVPKPALLTSTETCVPRASSASANPLRAAGSVTSQACTSAPSPSSAASSRRRSSRRATSVTRWPRCASSRATSAPMPDEAPVTTQVESGDGGGKAIGRREPTHTIEGMSSEDPFGGLFGDPEELRRRMEELAESMQGAQKVAWADNAIKLAVDMTVAGLTRLNLQGSVEQQAEIG